MALPVPSFPLGCFQTAPRMLSRKAGQTGHGSPGLGCHRGLRDRHSLQGHSTALKCKADPSAPMPESV